MKIVAGCRRALAIGLATVPFILVQSASAALWLHATATTVKASSSLVLVGVTEGMPVYLVPAREIKKFTPRCSGCAPYTPKPPVKPAILLGRGPSNGKKTRFVLPIPGTVPAGAYTIALYCATCYSGPGGSLILDTRSLKVTRG